MPTTYRLRPLDFRDLLDDTFDLYKDNFVLFASIAAVAYLPAQFLLNLSLAPLTAMSAYSRYGGGPGSVNPALALGSVALTVPFTVLLLSIAGYLAAGALTRAVSERYLGRTITLGEAYRGVWNRFGAFLMTLFLTYLLIGVGIGLCIGVPIFLITVAAIALRAVFESVLFALVGGLMMVVIMAMALVGALCVAFMFSFVIPVFIIEGRSGPDAISRSVMLFRYQFSKNLGTLLLITILVTILTGMVTWPVSMIAAGMGSGFLQAPMLLIRSFWGGAAQAVLQPISLSVITLLYYDVRIRREGFDLEIMASELGGGAPHAADPYGAAQPYGAGPYGAAPPSGAADPYAAPPSPVAPDSAPPLNPYDTRPPAG